MTEANVFLLLNQRSSLDVSLLSALLSSYLSTSASPSALIVKLFDYVSLSMTYARSVQRLHFGLKGHGIQCLMLDKLELTTLDNIETALWK